MIVVDVETSGRDPKKNSILSIGAVDFLNPKNQFYGECRIWEGAGISQEALQINGFSEREIKDANKQDLGSLIKKFLNWISGIEDKTIAGQNPSFDIGFLEDSINRYRIDYRIGRRSIDLHSVSYAHHLKTGIRIPLKKGRTELNTDLIFAYVGLPPEPKPHNALVGAKMEAEALSRLIYGRILLNEFRGYPLPSHLVRS
jgi:DNA polymerase III epsilon subunit-like protein